MANPHIFGIPIILALLSYFQCVTAPPPDTIFDFVVVGGGTAGCVVASRLSENGRHSVLLLEAGGMAELAIEVPSEQVMRVYPSVQQRNAGLENNGTIMYTVGYTLGGSSAVNGMNFNRGSPFDYDEWAKSTGDQSWSYSNMLKYFKKVENYSGHFPSDQHGYGGPIPVSSPWNVPGLNVWLKASHQVGYPYADPNGPQKISFAPIEFSQKFGRRVSSFTGYIKPILKSRKNLKVLIGTEVTKIEFVGKRAIGVVYRVNVAGRVQQRFVRVRKEVIVSAGVMGSPVLLMKSGVGPKQVLDPTKIPVVKYLPVGGSLRDHVGVDLYFAISNRSLIISPEQDQMTEKFGIFDKLGDGLYTQYRGLSTQAFISSSVAVYNGDLNWADLHIFSAFTSGLTEVEENIGSGETEITCSVVLTRPKSRGTVVLNSTNVDGGPVIDYQYFTHPDDMQVMLEGIKTTLKIYEETAAFRRLGTRLLLDLPVACRHLKFRSDEYWECFIRQRSRSFLHAGGTCKMGSGPRDQTAVVDSQLRVLGVDGLRVVDNSVMPTVTNANTMVPAYGIAEKASDKILDFWERYTGYHL